MRYNIVFKGLALLLAAALLVIMFLCGMLILELHYLNLYDNSLNTLLQEVNFYRAYIIAQNVVDNCAEKQFSDCPESIWNGSYIENGVVLGEDDIISKMIGIDREKWSYTILDTEGTPVIQATPEDGSGWRSFHFQLPGTYPIIGTEEDHDYLDRSTGEALYIKQQNSPLYNITVWIDPMAVENIAGFSVDLLMELYNFRYVAITALAVSAVVLLGLITYLCCAAGRKRGLEGVRPGGLNRLPLDIYMAVTAFVLLIAANLSIKLSPLYDKGWSDPITKITFNEPSVFETMVCIAILYSAAVTLLSFLFALVAQVKAPGRFWWHNSLVGRVWGLIWRILKKAWKITVRLFRMLPLMWRWLLTGVLIVEALGISMLLRSEMLIVLSLLLGFGMTLYGAYSFAVLLKGARRMAAGELNAHIPENWLWGDYRDLAAQMNALSHVVVEASDARLRSERMKTELITNVSHDIKTPLTSIINYVDLLKTAKDEETQWEYLQVLDRQSLRLKKLIDDLMELSKASSGNIQANIAPLDATEALKQALGEFSDKLQQSQLELCPHIPEVPVMIRADGRLFWRVLANLMSNAVKYAQPGTRVYVTLETGEAQAKIAVKNISREPLNISAQELMERFVRGDASRNTEGSGLGLSIAGSLMEVQKGNLQLEIDGDLFKATLSFPLE